MIESRDPSEVNQRDIMTQKYLDQPSTWSFSELMQMLNTTNSVMEEARARFREYMGVEPNEDRVSVDELLKAQPQDESDHEYSDRLRQAAVDSLIEVGVLV